MEGANKCILNHVRRHCGTLIVNAGFPRTVMAVTQGTALKTVCYVMMFYVIKCICVK